MYSLYMMYFKYMQQCSWCRAQLNSTELQESQIHLIPLITACIDSNPFIGHWDMMYSVYIMHDIYMQQ